MGSPLEQFEILPLLSIFFSITNSAFIIFITFGIFYSYYLTGSWATVDGWGKFFESIYGTVSELVFANIGKIGRFFLPLIFSIFLFILLFNLVGMVPYSFTITSHLIVIFSLALMLFIGFNTLGIERHRLNFLSLLLPSGASLALVPLLVPIELVSYLFRVISLPVRLFANMMAGHTLLKVIAGFAWTMVNLNGLMFFLHFIPLNLLVLLIGLELGVAMIQAYVFTILTCMYINDALNLH